MEKMTSTLLGMLVLAAAGIAIWGGRPRATPSIVVPSIEAAADAKSEDVAPDAGDATGIDDPIAAVQAGGMRPGYALLDGTRPPELPSDAPKSVKFGVVLVQYRGAERAQTNARPKAEALALAKSIAETARDDFTAAVARGDAGSMVTAGSMSQRVLEPALEYVLFTTLPGQVGGPVDTPTGYWIVKNTAKPR